MQVIEFQTLSLQFNCAGGKYSMDYIVVLANAQCTGQQSMESTTLIAMIQLAYKLKESALNDSCFRPFASQLTNCPNLPTKFCLVHIKGCLIFLITSKLMWKSWVANSMHSINLSINWQQEERRDTYICCSLMTLIFALSTGSPAPSSPQSKKAWVVKTADIHCKSEEGWLGILDSSNSSHFVHYTIVRQSSDSTDKVNLQLFITFIL